MKIIALTNGGCLIEATEAEVKEIMRSVTGETPKEIRVGQKIPAIDYASTITKIKKLKSDYDFNNLINRVNEFKETTDALQKVVEKASNIDI